ncbi:GGDEF domain-containing protein [Paenibacillus tarimensis]|uniref:GGDEF domain-containing protein n=1 Tax=Paenibacillus tarimensis TaxID=416012 RepID=UPI001F30C5B8|nr:GGDEF domain-containing protein [Paenibacillus tarimensis]MCF2943656.1 GGDEF domain-containing protein [Paenibacillus tarimensis]
MSRKGRAAGILYALVSSLVAPALILWAADGSDAVAKGLMAAAVLLSVSVPAGWYLGLRYDRLERQSCLDELTGVLNRRFIVRTVPVLLRKAGLKRKRISVSIIDLNGFKTINDTYGHAAGDQLLCRVTEVLTGIAAKGEIVARWGGDEFIVVCPYGSGNPASSLQRSIKESLDQLSLKTGLEVTAAIGTSVFPEDGETIHELIAAADGRMYRSKPKRSGQRHEAPLVRHA